MEIHKTAAHASPHGYAKRTCGYRECGISGVHGYDLCSKAMFLNRREIGPWRAPKTQPGPPI